MPSLIRKSIAADARPIEFAQPFDRLLSFREVYAFLGFRCKTSHTARSLTKRGAIRAVRINERVVKYSLASITELIAQGGVR
ncbi:MAG: hypothetical protein H7343_20335 [Undibacterium sp.]|nr:hypothetical protein [Opitutaceae bacterium]